ncbi:hypothetical protein, partial [Mesorhizobium sp.]
LPPLAMPPPQVYQFPQLEHLEKRAACLSITTVSAALSVPCELACRADQDGPGIFPRFDFWSALRGAADLGLMAYRRTVKVH